MQSTSALRSILLATLGAPNHAQTTEQDLYEQLMAHKHILLNLFDVGKRTAEQQRAVESGKITIRAKAMAVNSDFSRQAIFVSQQLDCSEQYAAELLHDVMSSHPNLVGDRCVETTIMEHHTRRRQVVECLKYVFDAAAFSPSTDASSLSHRLELFVREQLLSRQDGVPALTEKLLNEVDRIGETLRKVNVDQQNAGSSTVAPGQGINGAHLGADLLSARRDCLEYERAILSTSLFTIGRMGYLSGTEVCRMVDWLKANPRHPIVSYYLPTVLMAFDIVDPQSSGAKFRRQMISDANFVKQINNKLRVDNQWPDPGLKATILLKWTIFLTELRHRDPSLEEKEGFEAEQLESNIWNAIQGDCFLYLTNMVLRLQRTRDIPIPASLDQTASQDIEVPTEVPHDDFVLSFLEVLEILVRSLISHASSELRKIKQRQEDLLVAGFRADRSRTWRASSQSGTRHSSGTDAGGDQGRVLRNDVAAMFSFIGLLYSSLPPDHALPYWGASAPGKARDAPLESFARKLPSFLHWAVWSTQPQNLVMLTALYDMLTGLANGERCSELAYNFLVRGGADGAGDNGSMSPSQTPAGLAISWNSMFNVLDSWAAAGSSPHTNLPTNAFVGGFPAASPGDGWQNQGSQPQVHGAVARLSLSQQDVLVAQAFLHLLSTVATCSAAVRVTVCSHPRFRAVPTLVSLIPLNIPLELKGTLFDTLSSFCQPGAGASGLNICKSVWTLMERLEIINVRGGFAGSVVASVKGVEVELEEVESAYKVYPATIAFVKLLSTLIHTPKSILLSDSLSPDQISTIPEGLGHPYRTPGITPYVHFVIDNVFSNISRREYLRPSDRWRMNDACLSFVERCLASFDLESLAVHKEGGSTFERNHIIAMTFHPGYEIMKRLLTQSSLQAHLLSYISEGTDGFDKGLAEEQPFFRRTVIRVLRIVHRVVETQDLFLDILIPLLSDADGTTGLNDVLPSSYHVKLSQTLLFTSDYVSAIATYASYPAYLEARLLAVKILSLLATPSTIRQLGVIIDHSPNSTRILNGFLSILGSESWVDVDIAEIEATRLTGAGAPDENVPADVISQAVRVALLDMLTTNLSASLPYPNVSHLILFGEGGNVTQVRDPGGLDEERACVHVLLDLLNRGVPRSSDQVWAGSSEEPLFIVCPGLAERCYSVVYQLCKHPSTAVFVSRYLRSREDFFTRHLRAIPCEVPAVANPSAEVAYNDGLRVGTSISTLCSFLRLRSHIFNLVALELHVLTTIGQQKAVSDLLAVLFSSEGDALSDDVVHYRNDIFKPFREIGQAQSKIVEVLQRLDFDWSDGFTVQPVDLHFLSQLDLFSCLYIDRVGCEVIDRPALLSLLIDAKAALHAQGQVLTSAHAEQVSEEVTYILRSCAAENHRRQVQHAVATSFEAWGDVLNTALFRCFARIPPGLQENILLELLHTVPLALQPATVSPASATLLAEALVTTLTKIREALIEDRDLQRLRSVSLPPEQLHSFLRYLLNCIMDTSRSQVVRGNLYAALVQYLHLVIFLDDKTGSTTSHQRSESSWVSGSIDLIRTASDRLTNVIARDASDGSEVWRTMALTALDALIRFCGARCDFVAGLARAGHIMGFVKNLENSDAQLHRAINQTAGDLNALYVYEAMMSLFNRIVQNKAGAEKLLESGSLKVLTACDFLDAPLQSDNTSEGDGDYIPSLSSRFHQVLLPALQLCAGISLMMDSSHVSAVSQVQEFLNTHKEALRSSLQKRDESLTGTMECLLESILVSHPES